MIGCVEHRPYLAAVADGELEHVPVAALEHLRECPDCREEVELHRALGAKVQAATTGREPAEVRQRGLSRRAAMRAAGAALAVLLASGAAFAFLVSRPDPVLAAAAAAGRPPQFQSRDGAKIGSWCEQASGRPMPEVDLAPLSPVGARMDSSAGTGIVTVFYLTPEGRPVEVSWLDYSQMPAPKRSVTARQVNGHLVLITVSQHGTVVISGGAPLSVLWQAAAQIEDGNSS
jgi:hypothetical protein